MTKDQRTALRGVSLQHRHYAFIAATIAEIDCATARAFAAAQFADACKGTNPNFNRDRFLAACNLVPA